VVAAPPLSASLRAGVGGARGLIPAAGDASTREGDESVWVSKVNEFIGSSTEGFEAAAAEVVERANRTLRGITGVEILDKSVKVQDDAVVEYRVNLRLIFDMAPASELHW
jgi:flavin-binding protein dodecin